MSRYRYRRAIGIGPWHRRGIRMARLTCLGLALLCTHFGAWAKDEPLPVPLADVLPVEVYFDQPELEVSYSSARLNAASGGSPLGMIVVMGLQGKAERGTEESVAMLRDQLLDYSHSPVLQTLLVDHLRSPGLSPSPRLTWSRTMYLSDEESERLPAQALVLMPYYAIDQDFRRLFVRLDARLVERTRRSNGKLKVTERVFHRYEFGYLLPEDQPEGPEAWSRLGSPVLHRLLTHASTQTLDMLSHDFSMIGRAQWATNTRRQNATLNGREVDGKEERRGDDWIWVRTRTEDHIDGLQGYQILTSSVLAGISTSDANDMKAGVE